MSFGQALDNYTDEAGVRKEDVAKLAFVSPSSIRKYVAGTRKVPQDIMQLINANYDDPFLMMSAANEVTNDSWVPIFSKIDIHRSSTHLRALEGVQEALQALRGPITKSKERLSEQDLQEIKMALMKSIQAITALTNHVAMLCKAYGFSWFAIWKELRQELRAKGYIR
jgi:hypothetical protein